MKSARRKAIVRAFELILTFDTDKPDEQLEQQTNELIEEINKLLLKKFLKELPQIHFDNQKGKKKMKIGITPAGKDEDLD